LDEDAHQEQGYESSFMKMIQNREYLIEIDERYHVISLRDILDGDLDRFEGFRNNVNGKY
jgi:hypothetical protein